MADFRRGDLVELPDGERWTVETTPGNATEHVSLCRTGSAGPPLSETSSLPAAQLRLAQPRDLRSLGKGTDIDHILRQDRRRQSGGWLGEILRPARTVTPAGEAQIQRAAEAASYLERWRERGGQSRAWARWAARRAAQEEILRVTAENDPDVQAALRAPRPTGADTDSRPAPAAAQDPVAAFARYAAQVLGAWRETDADFLNSHRAELEAADPARFEAESAGLHDRQAALSAVAAALTASDTDVRAAAEERREAHAFNRSLLASVGAEYGGIPDLDPNIGSLAARDAAEGVDEADRAYDDAYDDAFGRYYGQVERTWDIDGSFPAVAGDIGVSPDSASWSPLPAPETKTHAGPVMDSDYYTARPGSEAHRAAYRQHFDATEGMGAAYPDDQEASYVADNYEELRIERWQAEMEAYGDQLHATDRPDADSEAEVPPRGDFPPSAGPTPGPPSVARGETGLPFDGYAADTSTTPPAQAAIRPDTASQPEQPAAGTDHPDLEAMPVGTDAGPGPAGNESAAPAQFVEVDGKIVPLVGCDWVEWAPCGCPVGTAAGRPDVTTEGDAWKVFYPREADRERAQNEGYRWELMAHERWSAEVADLMIAGCPHARQSAETEPGRVTSLDDPAAPAQARGPSFSDPPVTRPPASRARLQPRAGKSAGRRSGQQVPPPTRGRRQ